MPEILPRGRKWERSLGEALGTLATFCWSHTWNRRKTCIVPIHTYIIVYIPVRRGFAAEAQTVPAGVIPALSCSRSLAGVLQEHRTIKLFACPLFVIDQHGLASPLSRIGSAWQKKHSPSAAYLVAKIKSSLAKLEIHSADLTKTEESCWCFRIASSLPRRKIPSENRSDTCLIQRNCFDRFPAVVSFNCFKFLQD